MSALCFIKRLSLLCAVGLVASLAAIPAARAATGDATADRVLEQTNFANTSVNAGVGSINAGGLQLALRHGDRTA
jgi:hypothetical protein